MKCGIMWVQKNKLWIWKAYCRETGELIDWECGNRDSKTLEKMCRRLQRFKVKIYYTDNWEGYLGPLDCELVIQTKKETHGIENNNGRQRHWFARFRRRTCVVSRCSKMVDLTMFLFSKFHNSHGLWFFQSLRLSF